MNKTKAVNAKMFKKEREILQKLKHPNIINLIETFDTSKKFYIVTELSNGGELFDRIVDPKFNMTEKIVAMYMKQVLEALHHLHSRNIVHRDLKPENFIFQSSAVDAPIILIDFGTALVVEDDTEYTDLVGTPFYLAPESASNRPSRTGKMLKSSDIWSAGVITYICLTGSPPFYGNTNRQICHAIVRNKISFPDHKPPLSEGFKDWIGKSTQKRWTKLCSTTGYSVRPLQKTRSTSTPFALCGSSTTNRSSRKRLRIFLPPTWAMVLPRGCLSTLILSTKTGIKSSALKNWKLFSKRSVINQIPPLRKLNE